MSTAIYEDIVCDLVRYGAMSAIEQALVVTTLVVECDNQVRECLAEVVYDF